MSTWNFFLFSTPQPLLSFLHLHFRFLFPQNRKYVVFILFASGCVDVKVRPSPLFTTPEKQSSKARMNPRREKQHSKTQTPQARNGIYNYAGWTSDFMIESFAPERTVWIYCESDCILCFMFRIVPGVFFHRDSSRSTLLSCCFSFHFTSLNNKRLIVVCSKHSQDIGAGNDVSILYSCKECKWKLKGLNSRPDQTRKRIREIKLLKKIQVTATETVRSQSKQHHKMLFFMTKPSFFVIIFLIWLSCYK
jgi:hypothetical protein